MSNAPKLMDKGVKKVYIKDGGRKISTDTGHMIMPAEQARRMFGKMKGGKYSMIQEDARKRT